MINYWRSGVCSSSNRIVNGIIEEVINLEFESELESLTF